MMKKEIKALFEFLKEGKCSYFAAEAAKQLLDANGYTKLLAAEPWKLEAGGRYYVEFAAGALMAFAAPEKLEASALRMIMAHTDHPGFRLKSNAQMTNGAYVQLNTEVYGGPLYYSWLDRPLSLAGRVVIRTDDPFNPKSVNIDFKKPVLTIPSLAIHMNREANTALALGEQTDLIPICGISGGKIDLEAELAKLAGCKKGEILDYDLFVYDDEEPALVGFDEAFISAPALDDLVMVKAGLDALLSANASATHFNVLLLVNNEEIGSATIGGADSCYLDFLLDKLFRIFGCDEDEKLALLEKSFMISADVAHLKHPAHPEKHDPVLDIKPGAGPVIKMSAGNKYVTNAPHFSVFEALCEKAKVPVQKFNVRSNLRAGTTIGPGTASRFPIPAMDMGIALLGMHSARELCATEDFGFTEKAFEEFYKTEGGK